MQIIIDCRLANADQIAVSWTHCPIGVEQDCKKIKIKLLDNTLWKRMQE